VNIPIVYEDDWLLVLDKPSGLLTIPAPKKESRTLTGILNQDLEQRKLPYRLHPCHRLDRETSGLIIYAKGKSMQQKMMDLFKQKKINKNYIVFVSGRLSNKEGQIKSLIEGRNAVTNFRVVEDRNGFSVVEAVPLTGRTNQLRIHFKIMGHPVLGESKFAFRKDFKIKAKRLCLHAAFLEFIHPITNKKISLEAKLPDELLGFLRVH